MKTDLSRISLSRVIRRSFFLFMLGYALVSCVTSAPTPVCTAGNCVDGQGTYTYANGDKYVGEWRDNLPNGQGTMTYLLVLEYLKRRDGISFILCSPTPHLNSI